VAARADDEEVCSTRSLEEPGSGVSANCARGDLNAGQRPEIMGTGSLMTKEGQRRGVVIGLGEAGFDDRRRCAPHVHKTNGITGSGVRHRPAQRSPSVRGPVNPHDYPLSPALLKHCTLTSRLPERLSR
jgi:hypothetical protein